MAPTVDGLRDVAGPEFFDREFRRDATEYTGDTTEPLRPCGDASAAASNRALRGFCRFSLFSNRMAPSRVSKLRRCLTPSGVRQSA
jgi:hypothetical protein